MATINTLQTITETNPCFQCCFCKSGVVDEVSLGQLFMYDGVVVHYFCMLFSAALSQHGSDDEGILGFLPHDVMSEVRRSLRLKCRFCNIAGASVGCCNKKCRTAFHFPCGLKNGTNYQFFGNYESYCAEHVADRTITIPRKDWVCPICTSQEFGSLRSEAIQSSCCGMVVFHKECLQKLALSSGYFFKCPMCNNGKEFVHEMRSLGIFVPEQDASWEREPNAYEELYQQHSQCDVIECLCPKGKRYSAQKGSFLLARCRICGSTGTHKLCSNLLTVENWACEPCLTVEKNYAEKEKAEKQGLNSKAGGANKKKKLTEDTEQEMYVSARSGNRRVRNGRLNNRPRSKNIPWKFSDLIISNSCYWYFPYGKDKLSKYDKRPTPTLPDWRRLRLQVNLVNWIPKKFFEHPVDSVVHEEDHKNSGCDPTINQEQKEIVETIKAEESVKPQDDLKTPSPKPRTKKFAKKVIHKRSNKKTRWGQGIIRRQKKYTNREVKAQILHELVQSSDDHNMTNSSSTTLTIVPKMPRRTKPTPTVTKMTKTRSFKLYTENKGQDSLVSPPNREEEKCKPTNLFKEKEDLPSTGGLQQQALSIEDFEMDIQSNIEIDENNSDPAIQLSSFNPTDQFENQFVVGDLGKPDFIDHVEGSKNKLSEPQQKERKRYCSELANNNNLGNGDSKLVAKDSKVNTDELLPLMELNMDKGVGMSPSKMSFLMSSQRGLIQEIHSKPLHVTPYHIRTDHPYCFL